MWDGGKGAGKDRGLLKACWVMYKAVIQLVLLYGREIWVVADTMMTVLGVFHLSVSRRISRITARRGAGREWEW